CWRGDESRRIASPAAISHRHKHPAGARLGGRNRPPTPANRRAAPAAGAALRLHLVNQTRHAPNGKAVTLRAEAGDDTRRHARDVGVLAEGLALVDVGDVHLDDREITSAERVQNRDRGVGVSSGVDDNPAGCLARLMDPIDELVFAVALVKPELKLQLLGYRAAVLLDVAEGL